MEDMAPDLSEAVENFDDDLIKEFISHGFSTEHSLTATGITLYPLLMSISSEFLDSDIEIKPRYVSVLKALKKKSPNLNARDRFGRTALHHAAAAGNALGLQFTVSYLNYLYEKEENFKIPDGFVIPSVQALITAVSNGGVTPLMKAAEACSSATIVYLLSIGSDPLVQDNFGRTALSYAISAN